VVIDEDLVVLFKGAELAAGEPDLGAKLTELFFKVLAEGDVLPARILFLGAGVFLTTEGTPVLERLQALVEKGVDLVSCLTCLNYYDRTDRLVVGRPGDMKGTVDALLAHRKVITI
jgi:hypothetical protein